MRISEILRNKGSGVITVPPSSTVAALLATLDEWNIGAVVVSGGDGPVAGMASERDIVRHLHARGPGVLAGPVSAIMTPVVRTCAPEDPVDGLREIMTEHRVRHLPVLKDGELVGIVSIGDVVKSAIAALETERENLVQYIQR